MSLTTMYAPMANSPKTTLSAGITAADTSMTVADGNVFPTAPNLAVIGTSDSAEVVIYGSKAGNVLSNLIRGAGGTTASVWASGVSVARNFTALDHQTLIDNINDLDTRKANTADMGGIQVRGNYQIVDDSTTITPGTTSLTTGTLLFQYTAE